jgi:hypothetical protein
MRILLAAALLADELFQLLPNMADFFGPDGIGPAGMFDAHQMQNWRLTYYFFGTDNLTVLYCAFAVWVAVTVGFLIGWQTRGMSVLVWFFTRCFLERNPNIVYGGDSVLLAAVFLLMFTPSGDALSIDAWLKRRRGLLVGPAWVPPWSLRLMQVQLCLIYLSTGLIKLAGDSLGSTPLPEWNHWQEWPQWFHDNFQGTWWDGTSLHYFLNDTTMTRWSFVQFPLPFWITAVMTYFVVSWEILFPLLVMNRRTRPWTLMIGLLFHLGILVSVAIDSFVFYTLTFYALWTTDSFWRRFEGLPRSERGCSPSK